MRLWPAGAALAMLIGLSSGSTLAATVTDQTVAFVTELQQAIRTDDKTWLAAHLQFPVRYFGATSRLIRDKAWFVQHYASVIGPELKANVLAQDPAQVFENWQGVMIGDGSRNIWIRDFGEGDAPKFVIVTINNSD